MKQSTIHRLDYRHPTTSNSTRLRVAWLRFLIIFTAAIIFFVALTIFISRP